MFLNTTKKLKNCTVIYHFFSGFTAYLKGAPNYNFPMYRNLVNEITKAFQGVSQEIICIEKKLTESYQLHMVSSLIRKIQEVEKKKLEVVSTGHFI